MEFTEDVRREYRRMFRSVAVRPERRAIVAQIACSLAARRRRYERAGQPAGVPWWFVAILHELEPTLPLAESATDVLTRYGLADVGGWSITRALYRFERHDGFGYRRVRVPSPYLWSFSQHYERGQFAADGEFHPHRISRRCGAGVLLRTLVDKGFVAAV